jgi:hypothetical protein
MMIGLLLVGLAITFAALGMWPAMWICIVIIVILTVLGTLDS